MKIQPIKTKKDYQAALNEIEKLMDAKLNSPEGDKLDVLVTLVEAYEEKHHSIEAPHPIEAIKHAMEAKGLENRDLEPFIGGRGRVSEIMNLKRPLTMNMVRRLNRELSIPAQALIGEYELSGNT